MVTRALATLVVFGALGACADLISPERKLPGNFQVDLIFPKPNTTYAPTQWFPIVFGIQNVRNLWPLPVDFYVTIDDVATPAEERRPWHFSHSTLTERNLEAAADDAPGNMFFHIPTINMTNGTTSDYVIGWTVEFRSRCFENENTTQAEEELEKSLPEGHWQMDDIWTFGQGRHRITHQTMFSTSPDGILPDIEASAGSCQDYGSKTTSAARITEVNSVGPVCPKFETNITGSTCNYRSIAKELAANASSLLLGKMRCKEGDWRTIKAPCPKESKADSRVHVTASGWVLLVAVFFSIFSYNI